MNFKDNLSKYVQKTILKEFNQSNYFELGVFARLYNKELKYLRSAGFFDDKFLEQALEGIILKEARTYYDLVTRGAIHADHLPRPAFLVYALMRDDVFSEKEKNDLPLDHSMTLEDFCRMYEEKNLINKLRREFLNPKKIWY